MSEHDFSKTQSETEQAQFLVRYALLAANSHNTQPWKFRVHNQKVVTGIEAVQDRDREHFAVSVQTIDTAGVVREEHRFVCRSLFVATGSVKTSELLVKAKGTLPRLNEYVGRGWGNNGDTSGLHIGSISTAKVPQLPAGVAALASKNECFCWEYSSLGLARSAVALLPLSSG